ncbi:hypothetical protein BC831DRAFT_452544 [Entophlyctis helioformis]|nr:hypothetical protein BC831DRAFT_452544 [Entophlyctis helioformis]
MYDASNGRIAINHMFLTYIVTVISLVGLAGNALIIYTIAVNKRLRSQPSTLINLNLAITDSLTTVTYLLMRLPEIAAHWASPADSLDIASPLANHILVGLAVVWSVAVVLGMQPLIPYRGLNDPYTIQASGMYCAIDVPSRKPVTMFLTGAILLVVASTPMAIGLVYYLIWNKLHSISMQLKSAAGKGYKMSTTKGSTSKTGAVTDTAEIQTRDVMGTCDISGSNSIIHPESSAAVAAAFSKAAAKDKRPASAMAHIPVKFKAKSQSKDTLSTSSFSHATPCQKVTLEMLVIKRAVLLTSAFATVWIIFTCMWSYQFFSGRPVSWAIDSSSAVAATSTTVVMPALFFYLDPPYRKVFLEITGRIMWLFGRQKRGPDAGDVGAARNTNGSAGHI